MRFLLPFFALLLVCTVLGGSPSMADGPADIDEILNKVRAIENRTQGLAGMINTLAESRNGTERGTPLRDLIERGKNALTRVANRESQRLEDFLDGPEPQRIRAMLKDYVRDMRDLTNAQIDVLTGIELPCGPPVALPHVTLQRLLDAIDEVPALALYPIHLAGEVTSQLGDLSGKLRCLVDRLVENAALLRDVLSDNADPEVVVNSGSDFVALKGLATLLKLVAWLTKKQGSQLIEISQTIDMQLEGEIWGFVGLDVDAEIVLPMGEKVSGLSSRLQMLSDWLTTKLQHYQVISYQQAIIENQALILARLGVSGGSSGPGTGAPGGGTGPRGGTGTMGGMGGTTGGAAGEAPRCKSVKRPKSKSGSDRSKKSKKRRR